MDGLCLLGVDNNEEPKTYRRGHTTAATLGGGVAMALLWKRHPVLGLLNGMAIGANASRYMTKEIGARRAIENLGAHAVATVASLSLPAYPALGYIGGAAGANLFIRDRGDSYLERLDEIVLGADTPSLADLRAGKGTLKKGAKGDAVKYVQAIVGVPVDGDFGPATQTAVVAFQRKNGLGADGVVGKATIAALDKAASSTGGFSSVDFTDEDGGDGTPRAGRAPQKGSASAPAGTNGPGAPAGASSSSSLPPAGGQSTALVPAGKSGETQLYSRGSDGNLLILNRPAWQVALAGLGIAALGGGALMLATGK